MGFYFLFHEPLLYKPSSLLIWFRLCILHRKQVLIAWSLFLSYIVKSGGRSFWGWFSNIESFLSHGDKVTTITPSIPQKVAPNKEGRWGQKVSSPYFPALCLFTGQRSHKLSLTYTRNWYSVNCTLPRRLSQQMARQSHWLQAWLILRGWGRGLTTLEAFVAKPNWLVLTMEGGIIAEEYVTSSVCPPAQPRILSKFGHRRDEYFPFFFFFFFLSRCSPLWCISWQT